MSFDEILARLSGGRSGTCRYQIGSAWFGDEQVYDRLGEQYARAVSELSAVFGEPISGKCVFPGIDVEQVSCWNHAGKIVYAMLSFEDSTRIRVLTLGVTRRGTVQFPESDPSREG